MNELTTSISKMIVNGNRLELPKNEHFSNYAQVKTALVKAGGKYKKNGFEFTSPAEAIKLRLVGGEKIDDKKKFQFFATPEPLAMQLVDLADIGVNDRVMEPSAGQGAIADVIVNTIPVTCFCIELMPENVKILIDKDHNVYEGDFLKYNKSDIDVFDKIVANPPFTKNQDIDHIRHMYELLDNGGRLVSLSSKSWVTGSQKKQVAFREWLFELGAEMIDVDEGSFKQSGTNVGGMIIIINKGGYS